MKDPEIEAVSAFIHTSTVAMTIADPNQDDCPVISANAAFQELTGYSTAMTEGRNCRFLQGDFTDRAERLRLANAVTKNEPCVSSLLNFTRDGKPFNNMLLLEPLQLASGKLVYVGCQFGFDLSLELGAIHEEAKYRFGEVDRIRRVTGNAPQTFRDALQMRAETAVMSVRNYMTKRALVS